MVNTVYFGLSARINNIEEAVFFLGLRRIRELALATPVIEDLEKLQSTGIPARQWKDLWAHSVGAATLSRDILSSAPVRIGDDTDYLVGLLHNVGRIVMAYTFPEELGRCPPRVSSTPEEVCALERELIGWDPRRSAPTSSRSTQMAPRRSSLPSATTMRSRARRPASLLRGGGAGGRRDAPACARSA